MARRLTREEGIFAGTSSGTNALAALVLVTLIAGSRVKYLSTDVDRSP